ncbi:inositol monophosphatase family protein [Pseudomonadota bacterium]
MVDLKQLMTTAAEAADKLMLAGLNDVHQYHAKGDRDYALSVDLDVEREVKSILAASEIPVLGEEFAWQGEQQSERFWVVDPVDGTINYARGIPLCGICIALVQNGQAVLSCISLPFLNEFYIAEKDRGATLNNAPLSTSPVNQLNEAIVALGDFAVGNNSEEKNRLRLSLVNALAPHVMRIRMLGSAAVQLAWLAAGRLDISVILSNNAWDVQAGVLIAREAGALVCDGDGSHHTTDSRYALASTPPLASALLARLAMAEDDVSKIVTTS